MKAMWKDQVIAESNDTVVVEGNHYFPSESVNKEFLHSVDTTTSCAWKGTASYYDVVVNGEKNPGAAWCYANPKPEVLKIKGRIAFWKGIKVLE